MDNTKRFSDRVENYKKYRPDYPIEVIGALKDSCGLNKSSVIADIGSGTGIFSALLLPVVRMVYAIEPNAEMRKAAEEALSSYGNFNSRDACAEDTGLDSHSIDIVTAATAFHWFDKEKTKREFSRILKKNKWVILIWNERNKHESEFLIAYEAIFNNHIPEYATKHHKNVSALFIDEWYGPGKSELITFRNHKKLNWEGLLGRFLSSSYAPRENQPHYARVIDELKQTYERCAHNDAIVFEYTTRLYVGKI
jgi:SAM-dependent methyltransferase